MCHHQSIHGCILKSTPGNLLHPFRNFKHSLYPPLRVQQQRLFPLVIQNAVFHRETGIHNRYSKLFQRNTSLRRGKTSHLVGNRQHRQPRTPLEYILLHHLHRIRQGHLQQITTIHKHTIPQRIISRIAGRIVTHSTLDNLYIRQIKPTQLSRSLFSVNSPPQHIPQQTEIGTVQFSTNRNLGQFIFQSFANHLRQGPRLRNIYRVIRDKLHFPRVHLSHGIGSISPNRVRRG